MENEMNLKKFFYVILRRWKFIAIFVFAITLAGLWYAFSLPNVYKVSASILPLLKTKGSGEQAFSSRGPITVDETNTILKSTMMARRVVERQDLIKFLYPELWDEKNRRWKVENVMNAARLSEATERLGGIVSIRQRGPTIIIAVECQDPEIAFTIVEAYINELALYFKEADRDFAKQKKSYVERLMEQYKSQLDGVRSENGKPVSGKMLDQLAYEYAIAKVDETENEPKFQVMDPPKRPINKSGPPRRKIVAGSFLGSFLLPIYLIAILDKKKLS